jgi:hypothetical protein
MMRLSVPLVSFSLFSILFLLFLSVVISGPDQPGEMMSVELPISHQHELFSPAEFVRQHGRVEVDPIAVILPDPFGHVPRDAQGPRRCCRGLPSTFNQVLSSYI